MSTGVSPGNPAASVPARVFGFNRPERGKSFFSKPRLGTRPNAGQSVSFPRCWPARATRAAGAGSLPAAHLKYSRMSAKWLFVGRFQSRTDLPGSTIPTASNCAPSNPKNAAQSPLAHTEFRGYKQEAPSFLSSSGRRGFQMDRAGWGQIRRVFPPVSKRARFPAGYVFHRAHAR